jgi:hypothetical protein
MRGNILDAYSCFLTLEENPTQFIGRTEEILFGMRPACNGAGEEYPFPRGDDIPESPGSGVIPGQDKEWEVIVADEAEKHRSGSKRSTLWCRDRDDMMWPDRIAVFVVLRLDAETEPRAGLSRYEKRVLSRYQENLVLSWAHNLRRHGPIPPFTIRN